MQETDGPGEGPLQPQPVLACAACTPRSPLCAGLFLRKPFVSAAGRCGPAAPLHSRPTWDSLAPAQDCHLRPQRTHFWPEAGSAPVVPGPSRMCPPGQGTSSLRRGRACGGSSVSRVPGDAHPFLRTPDWCPRPVVGIAGAELPFLCTSLSPTASEAARPPPLPSAPRGGRPPLPAPA